jgi:hypothetical protein
MKIVPVAAEFLYADEWTGGQTDITGVLIIP